MFVRVFELRHSREGTHERGVAFRHQVSVHENRALQGSQDGSRGSFTQVSLLGRFGISSETALFPFSGDPGKRNARPLV